MEAIFRHTLKLALVGAFVAGSALAAPQSQDPPPPTQDPAKTPPPAQQQTQQQTGSQPVQQKDTVTPKNSKEDVDAIGNRNVGKGVNLFSLEREIALGKQLAQEVERSSKLIDVFRNDGVVNELRGALNFLIQLLAEGDFAFERKKVNALANVTVTDGFDVFLGVLGSDGVLLRDRLGASRPLRLLLGGRRCLWRILAWGILTLGSSEG